VAQDIFHTDMQPSSHSQHAPNTVHLLIEKLLFSARTFSTQTPCNGDQRGEFMEAEMACTFSAALPLAPRCRFHQLVLCYPAHKG